MRPIQALKMRHTSSGIGLPSTFAEARDMWDAEDLNATLNDNDDVTASDVWTSQVSAMTCTTNSAIGGTSTNPKFRTGVFNGRACIRSVSTTHAMSVGSSFSVGLNGTNGATIIYVGQVAASVSGGGLFGDFGSGHATHYPFTDGNVYSAIFSADRPSWGNATTALQAQHIGVVRVKTSHRNWRVAEVERYNDLSGTFSAGFSPKLFVTRDGGIIASWAGDLAWWVLIPRFLTDAEVIEWETYLKDPTMFDL